MAYTYDGCCGSCIHMNTNDYVGHKDHCYCTYRKQYYNLTERKCSYYEYDRNKDYYDLNHRWHIVAAVLSVLQGSSKELGIEEIACLRENVLEKEERYDMLLRTYDIVGPFLAGQIVHDADADALCHMLLVRWLQPISKKVDKNNTDEALQEYFEMVNALCRRYAKPLEAYCTAKRMCAKALLSAWRI